MSVRLARRGAIAASRVSAPATVTALDLPGTSGNYASTPDSAAVSITGDIDIRARLTLDDWTRAQYVVGKMTSTISYGFAVLAAGTLYLTTSQFGGSGRDAISTVATGFTDGTTHWIRVTRVASSGVTTFYTSDDATNDPAAVSWTQLGTTVNPGSGAILDSTLQLVVGTTSDAAGAHVGGIVHYADIRSTIGGSPVAKFDPSGVTILGTRNPSSFVAPTTGETWTMNGSGWDWVAA